MSPPGRPKGEYRSAQRVGCLMHLLGDDRLCARYEAAFALAGMTTERAAQDATTRGQWRVAVQAGLT